MILMDKAALLNTIATEVHYDSERPLEMYAKLLSVVNDAPTIDAVEVVRCKDCKFFDHDDFGKGEEYWCKHFVSTYDNTHCHKVMEDDFCAWGERR